MGFDKNRIRDEKELEEVLSTPSPELIETLSGLSGDILILGAGGKMGPSLARLAKRAIDASGKKKKIIGVSRFSSKDTKTYLNNQGIETIPGDLLDQKFLAGLPGVENVIYLAGMKFGSTGNLPLTWAMNTYLPSLIGEKFKKSRLVALSTGNVYPFVKIKNGGCTEDDMPAPIGEYAQSCLGRERVFQYFSQQYSIPMSLIRLNYAVDIRYGVLVDIATKVSREEPVDVTMGYVNVIWQGDANSMILRSLSLCQSPARILNLTGPEVVSVRWLAEQFGQLLNKEPKIVGEEAETALLNNAVHTFGHFGYPTVSLKKMIGWIAEWIKSEKPLLNKPTHFETRTGAF